MEIIIAFAVFCVALWWFFIRDDKKPEASAPYKVETPPTKIEAIEPEATTPAPVVVEAPAPAKAATKPKAPAKPRAPAKPKAAPKAKPAAKTAGKPAGKPKVTVAK